MRLCGAARKKSSCKGLLLFTFYLSTCSRQIAKWFDGFHCTVGLHRGTSGALFSTLLEPISLTRGSVEIPRNETHEIYRTQRAQKRSLDNAILLKDLLVLARHRDELDREIQNGVAGDARFARARIATLGPEAELWWDG